MWRVPIGIPIKIKNDETQGHGLWGSVEVSWLLKYVQA